VFVGAGIVLVKRGHEPLAGRWTLPGGVVDAGESLAAATVREIREETGLDILVGPMVEVYEHIERDGGGRTRFHHVIVDYACRACGGTLRAGDDAADVALADPGDLDRWTLTEATRSVIAKALRAVEAGGVPG
jgi:8-oxo-dGTP diphosphatase